MVKRPRYRIRLRCAGLRENEVSVAPKDILEGFSHRPWHKNVSSHWDGTYLWLEAENDYDPDGRALWDEFSDEVTANVNWTGPINISIVSVDKLED